MTLKKVNINILKKQKKLISRLGLCINNLPDNLVLIAKLFVYLSFNQKF